MSQTHCVAYKICMYIGTFQVFPQSNLRKPDLKLWSQNITFESVAGYIVLFMIHLYEHVRSRIYAA